MEDKREKADPATGAEEVGMAEKAGTRDVGARARELFLSDCNCAESVLLSTAEHLGLRDDLLPAVASGFGGGIARTGQVCGAISGAAIAAGCRYGRGMPEADRDRLYAIVSSLVKDFASTFGSTNCIDLVGYTLSDPVEFKKALESRVFAEKCAGFVEFCALTISNILGSQPA